MNETEVEQYDKEFMPGIQNRTIRYYFYLNNGLNVLNQFRNLFLGLIALYIAMKFESYWILGALFIPSVLILTIVGYYSVHHMSKVTEWLNLRFGTHYGIKQFNYTQAQYEMLEEIRDLLKQK